MTFWLGILIWESDAQTQKMIYSLKTIFQKLKKIFWSNGKYVLLTIILCRTKYKKIRKPLFRNYFMSKQIELYPLKIIFFKKKKLKRRSLSSFLLNYIIQHQLLGAKMIASYWSLKKAACLQQLHVVTITGKWDEIKRVN